MVTDVSPAHGHKYLILREPNKEVNMPREIEIGDVTELLSHGFPSDEIGEVIKEKLTLAKYIAYLIGPGCQYYDDVFRAKYMSKERFTNEFIEYLSKYSEYYHTSMTMRDGIKKHILIRFSNHPVLYPNENGLYMISIVIPDKYNVYKQRTIEEMDALNAYEVIVDKKKYDRPELLAENVRTYLENSNGHIKFGDLMNAINNRMKSDVKDKTIDINSYEVVLPRTKPFTIDDADEIADFLHIKKSEVNDDVVTVANLILCNKKDILEKGLTNIPMFDIPKFCLGKMRKLFWFYFRKSLSDIENEVYRQRCHEEYERYMNATNGTRVLVTTKKYQKFEDALIKEFWDKNQLIPFSPGKRKQALEQLSKDYNLGISTPRMRDYLKAYQIQHPDEFELMFGKMCTQEDFDTIVSEKITADPVKAMDITKSDWCDLFKENGINLSLAMFNEYNANFVKTHPDMKVTYTSIEKKATLNDIAERFISQYLKDHPNDHLLDVSKWARLLDDHGIHLSRPVTNEILQKMEDKPEYKKFFPIYRHHPEWQTTNDSFTYNVFVSLVNKKIRESGNDAIAMDGSEWISYFSDNGYFVTIKILQKYAKRYKEENAGTKVKFDKGEILDTAREDAKTFITDYIRRYKDHIFSLNGWHKLLDDNGYHISHLALNGIIQEIQLDDANAKYMPILKAHKRRGWTNEQKSYDFVKQLYESIYNASKNK